jgi:hypothetical protein
MDKTLFKRVTIPVSMIAISFLLYIFTDFFCFRYGCYVMLGDNRYEPLVSGILWFIPTLVVLGFSGREVIVSWLRHIAWWYVFFTPWAITHLSDNFFFPDTWISGACMVILFVITLIYAPLMNRRFKKGQAGAASK